MDSAASLQRVAVTNALWLSGAPRKRGRREGELCLLVRCWGGGGGVNRLAGHGSLGSVVLFQAHGRKGDGGGKGKGKGKGRVGRKCQADEHPGPLPRLLKQQECARFGNYCLMTG